MSAELPDDKFSPSRKLNFVIAICAILISAASFVATYLQAKAADQQVMAMTYPMIQYSTGNWDIDSRESVITFELRNNGVGPAIIRNIKFEYQDREIKSLQDFLLACCDDGLKALKASSSIPATASIVTSQTSNIVLSVNEEKQMMSLAKHPSNQPLWDKLNEERFKLRLSICYCSLLENCYWTDGRGTVSEVNQCG